MTRMMPLLMLLTTLVAAGDGTSAAPQIPDVTLSDQDGRSLNFYTDLVKGKVVAINFIFTTCPTICPPLGVNFGKLQQRLGDHASRNINLISVSINPTTDTSQRLKAWSQKFGRQPGWTLVTGSKREVDTLLKALKSFSADITSHSPTLLVGNDRTGRWTRANGLSAPSQLQRVIEEIDGTASEKGDQ